MLNIVKHKHEQSIQAIQNVNRNKYNVIEWSKNTSRWIIPKARRFFTFHERQRIQ